MIYVIFQRVSAWTLQGDFYVNQVLIGHGVFGVHQAQFSDATLRAAADREESTINIVRMSSLVEIS